MCLRVYDWMYSLRNIACEQALLFERARNARVSGEAARGVPAVASPFACLSARVLFTISQLAGYS